MSMFWEIDWPNFINNVRSENKRSKNLKNKKKRSHKFWKRTISYSKSYQHYGLWLNRPSSKDRDHARNYQPTGDEISDIGSFILLIHIVDDLSFKKIAEVIVLLLLYWLGFLGNCIHILNIPLWFLNLKFPTSKLPTFQV